MTTRQAGPTPFEELNAVLGDLVRETRSILGEAFVGAYLQGSFALGAGDMNSDCDFLVVTARAVTDLEYAALAALHDEIPTREGHWTQHLEGSYPVLDELRTLDGLGRPWPYIDHGWRELQRDTHCNSEVARWILREHGIALAGAPVTEVVDEVPASALRDRMRVDLPTLLNDLNTWLDWDIAWCQRYAATTFSRVLHTLNTGTVTSKRAALEWAIVELDSQWQPLLRQVIDDRAIGFDAGDPPRPGSVEATLAFAAFCLDVHPHG